MAEIFDKKIFNSFNNKINLKNIKSYEINFDKFDRKSFFSKIYPSLLSKSFFFKDGNYWEKIFTFRRENLIINPFRLLRLTYSYIKILFFFIINLRYKYKILFVLTRSNGIHNRNSFEDYRFRGLEEKLLKNHKIIYFYHGARKSILSKNNLIVYSSDIYCFSRFIFLFIYPFLKLNLFIRKKVYYLWNYDLIINSIASIITSLFANFVDASFFWDFNYYHYPLFFGSYLSKSKLIGSMHNFNYYGQLPWISNKVVKHLKIPYSFNDYSSIYKYLDKNNIPIEERSFIRWNSQDRKLNFVIIQENQTDQESLIAFVSSFKKRIDKIYIKLRPDKDKINVFFNLLKKYHLSYEVLDNIFDVETSNYIFIGTSSSLLLDLSAKGKFAVSYSEDRHKFFEYPSRNFANLSPTKIEKGGLLTIQNPFYINSVKDFQSVLDKELILIPSNSTNNHFLFNKYKIQSIFNLICKSN